MPQLHKGKYGPFAFRRDLWPGVFGAYRFPQAMKLVWANWTGTLGVALNSVTGWRVDEQDYDAATNEIIWSSRESVGGHVGTITFIMRVESDMQVHRRFELNFPGYLTASSITGEVFAPSLNSNNYISHWSKVGGVRDIITSDAAKFDEQNPSTITYTGLLW